LRDTQHVLGVAGASVGQQTLTATLALTAPTGDASLELASGTAPLTSVRVRGGTTKVVTVPAGQPTFVRVTPGSSPVVAARVLTAANQQGDLVTGSSLTPAAV